MRDSEPSGSIVTALAHCARLIETDPALALEQAGAVLAVVPGHPQALLYLGVAQRRTGDRDSALATLDVLARAQPNSADAAFELGLTLVEAGRHGPAEVALVAATRLRPAHTEAWRVLGDLRARAGDQAAADAAYAMQIRASVDEPALLAAATALIDNKLAIAEALLRDYLRARPMDAAALRMLAEVALRLGRLGDAESLFADCLAVAPGFVAARRSYATLLYRSYKSEAALAELDRLPRDPGTRNMRAAVLARIGDFAGSIGHYAAVLADHPIQPKAWMSYGHALKTVGRLDECIAAYRTAIAQAPELGEAWWSLANLKTVRFSADDIAAMEAQLTRSDLSEEDRFHLDFALGKAFEDTRSFERSFRHYAAANWLRRTHIDYDAAELTGNVARAAALFDEAFFAARAGWGSDAPDPIFIVGLPRAGSTLIEQILSSHSQIEGTAELPDIIAISKAVGGRRTRDQPTLYPGALASLSKTEVTALGDGYIASTRIQRKTDRPYFIDKMPNNFQHIGLIATILPHARIVDARRDPMGCCFAGFKQHFAHGQNFSTSLEDIALYYRDYVALTAHFDRVLPGRVHRVSYEAMVANQESETRSLLDYLGLPFEATCLDFHRTERSVRTPSSEQVRRPIYADAVEQWRNYEPWLQPLRAALRPLLDSRDELPSGEYIDTGASQDRA